MNTNIAPETLLDDLHPSRFLKVADLLDRWHVQQVIVTISRMTSERQSQPVRHRPGDQEAPRSDAACSVLPDQDQSRIPRGYLLSAGVDVESLKAATNARTAGELIGKKIIIKVGEHKRKAVLRISPVAPEG